MQLEEFFDYKNQLMEDLLTNKEIIRLLDDNFTVIEEPQTLAYKQVHPYEYIPEGITYESMSSRHAKIRRDLGYR